MSDYKATLNLPQTDFPMKANLAQREPERLKAWAEMDLYGQMRQAAQGKPTFILHDGPPYANGELHVGHAINKILKDIIIKSKTLSGFDAPYVPGWDCHGLPIELNVEKKVGKPGHKVTAAEFRQKCRDYASKQVEAQKADFVRMGVFGDWAKPYLTMDFRFEANIVRTLAKIIDRGHLHRGFKPVHWCLDCGSALAEAEVEYADKQSSAVDVAFPFVDRAEAASRLGCDDGEPIDLAIWTTTPWTLPANRAVALSADLDYVLLDLGGRRVLVADALAEDCAQRFGAESHEIIGRVTAVGSAIEHVKVGARAGVGWQSAACHNCEWCLRGDEQLCGAVERLRAVLDEQFLKCGDCHELMAADDVGAHVCGAVATAAPRAEMCVPCEGGPQSWCRVRTPCKRPRTASMEAAPWTTDGTARRPIRSTTSRLRRAHPCYCP